MAYHGPAFQWMLFTALLHAVIGVGRAVDLSLVASHGDGASSSTPVLVRGELQGLFVGCTPEATNTKSECLTVDEYSSAAELHVRGAELGPKPAVKTSSSTLQATIAEVSTVNDDSVSLRVSFSCKTKSRSIAIVSVSLVLEEIMHKFSFAKACVGGVNDAIEYGMILDDGEEVLLKNFTVPPVTVVSNLFFRTTRAGALQSFEPVPIVAEPKSVVRVSLRGMTSTNLIRNEANQLSIHYSCLNYDKAKITLLIKIPPWDNLRLEWTKYCGGKTPESLSISTTAELKQDVMSHGELRPKFRVDHSLSGLVMDKAALFESPANSSHVSFFLQNDKDAESHLVTVQSVSISVLDTSVASAKVLDSNIGRYIPETGGSIHEGQTRRVKAHVRCLHDGSTMVVITMHILGYENVEFGFMKTCEYAHSRFDPPSFFREIDAALHFGSVIFVVVTSLLFVAFKLRRVDAAHYHQYQLANVRKTRAHGAS